MGRHHHRDITTIVGPAIAATHDITATCQKNSTKNTKNCARHATNMTKHAVIFTNTTVTIITTDYDMSARLQRKRNRTSRSLTTTHRDCSESL